MRRVWRRGSTDSESAVNWSGFPIMIVLVGAGELSSRARNRRANLNPGGPRETRTDELGKQQPWESLSGSAMLVAK
jgi:hypothetical protein